MSNGAWGWFLCSAGLLVYLYMAARLVSRAILKTLDESKREQKGESDDKRG